MFREICGVDVTPDGLSFDVASVSAKVIREDEEYEGVRITLTARLGPAAILVQVDVGFGDAVTPGPVEGILPPLLDFPAVRMRMYPPETVVAEKFEVMVKRGLSNTRMKDLYDLFILSETRAFEGASLREAVVRTFASRGTLLPLTELPVGLTSTFALDPVKRSQWLAYLDKNELRDVPRDLEIVVERLRNFLGPAASNDDRIVDPQTHWRAGVGWSVA
jgi:hypothetical protein